MIENIRLSFQGIISHKIRSFLTMLGIIIGIAAIIAIVSTIEGTNEEIKNNLIGGGTNTVRITLSSGEEGYYDDRTPENVRAIPAKDKKRILDLKEVEKCTLYRKKTYYEGIYYDNQNLMESATIYGIDEDYFDTEGYQVVEGISFTDKQYTDYSKVLIVDTVLVNSVFNGESALGKVLDIDGEPFKIIGVVTKRSEFEPTINSVDEYYTYNQSQGGLVFMPTNDWSICFGFDVPQQCTIKAVDTNSMTNAGKKTADILNENVRKPTMEEGAETADMESASVVEYKSESMLEKAQDLQNLSKSTNKMLIMIASISLLVGGIGVMNIMLVSVTERTREIGLKKALGARKIRILAQFLTEAAVLTTIGGIVGVLSGIGLAQVMSNMTDTPVSISTLAIVVSVAFSMVVGIVFGFIPSIKAANLNPIDALRYE